DTVAGAKMRAYQAVKAIRWDGAWCRHDISDKARVDPPRFLHQGPRPAQPESVPPESEEPTSESDGDAAQQ
ncbi:MAG TPA: hypothetical protein VHB77_01590, partial [Planctomycetaceae bacterium]|nr:hypothetical protein [Planctomycetaceae bacterium]